MATARFEAKTLSSSHTVIASSSTSHATSFSRPVVSTLQRLLWIGNLLYYQLLAVLTAVMLWVFFANTDLNRPILWHMVFSTISYIPLMAVAIIAFSQDNLPTLYINRVRIYVIHGILLTISCLGVTTGIAVKINDNIKNGSKHFQSNHAILGLTSWLLVFCAVCFGIVAQNTQNFAKYIRPVLAKLIHNVLGISAFTLGVVSIMVMYPSHHYVHFLPKSAYYASFLIAGYIIIWSLLAAFRSLYFQIKSLAF